MSHRKELCSEKPFYSVFSALGILDEEHFVHILDYFMWAPGHSPQLRVDLSYTYPADKAETCSTYVQFLHCTMYFLFFKQAQKVFSANLPGKVITTIIPLTSKVIPIT